jgi:hypothetical protein
MKSLALFFVFSMLSLGTALAAVPNDGVDKQFDVSMFEQLPVMNLQATTANDLLVTFDQYLDPVKYKQTSSAVHRIDSEVANGADAVGLAGIAGLTIFDKKTLKLSPGSEVGWSRSLN